MTFGPLRLIIVGVPMLLALAATILGCISFAGSTNATHYPINQIYTFKLQTATINLSTVLGSEFDAVSALLPSISASTLGLSDIYTIGLWGYCKGDYDTASKNEYKVTYCSKPKAMYQFDLVQVITDQISQSIYELTHIDVSGLVQLPADVTQYVGTAQLISRVIFVTGIIGVITAFIALVITTLSLCSHLVSIVATLVSAFSFIMLAISAGCVTGVYYLIEKYFNTASSLFGLSATLGNKMFYALYWSATVAMLVATATNLIAIFCGLTLFALVKQDDEKEKQNEDYYGTPV